MAVAQLTGSTKSLAPYAEKNYQKHLKDAEEWVLPEKREDYAWQKTKKDIYDAMQSLEYEINTLFTSNGTNALYFAGLWAWNQSLRTGNSKGHSGNSNQRTWFRTPDRYFP